MFHRKRTTSRLFLSLKSALFFSNLLHLVSKDWERELEEILTFYKYPYETRRMLATVNFVESINSKIRKVIYGKRIFLTDEALLKVCYGVGMDLEEGKAFEGLGEDICSADNSF
ncbi:transposase [Hydrogenobacter sp. T-2]|nr:transposase [Hydrogenobacter sp. T-2]